MRRLLVRTFLPLILAALCTASSGSAQTPAEPPTAAGKQANLEREYETKIRELARLRDQIDRILKDLDRSPQTPGFTPQPATPPEEPASVPAAKIESVGYTGGGFAFNLSLGWEFQVNSKVQVTDLGVWDHNKDGLDGDFPVGLWDADGKLLVSAQVPAGDKARLVETFRYTSIKPIELEPGRRYVIAALYTPKTKEQEGSYGISFSTPAAVRWLKARRGKTPELAMPDTSMSDQHQAPGSFGPNLLLAPAEGLKGTRSHYRVVEVPQPPKMQTIVVPEQDDGSHREQKVVTVSLFANVDGQLTQVLVEDKPLGVGPDAFKKLVEALKPHRNRTAFGAPRIRVAAMPQVKASDLQAAMGVVERGHYNDRERWNHTRNVEVCSLYAARISQPQANGKFVVADRFRDAGEYVEDRWTGLLWQKDGTASGKKNFDEARDYAASLELEGLKEWRVPKIDELATIFPATFEPFKNTKYTPNQCCTGPDEFTSYWTSELDLPTPDYAFVYQWYAKGGANNGYASRNYVYVRCVHDPVERTAE